MNKLNFISYTLAIFIILTNYGFSDDVKVIIDLPAKFQDSGFQIAFPHIGTAWGATLNHVHTQTIPVPPYQDLQGIMIRRTQVGKEDVISCTPESFSYKENLTVELKYDNSANNYGKSAFKFHDGLYCTVTGN